MSGGKGGGSRGPQSTTQTATPWSGQAPYLTGLYQQAANLPVQQHYPGQTVADQAPETLQGLNMQAATAQAGSPAISQWNKTLAGDYLHGGPGFNAALQAAHSQIAPMVQGQFAAGGRYGSGLAQEAETSALANAFAGMYGQERANQMQAMSMPSLGYGDAAALRDVGSSREGYQQALLSDQLNRWNFAQQAPYDRLGVQSGIIQGGFPGGTQVSTADYGPPRFGDPEHMMNAAFGPFVWHKGFRDQIGRDFRWS